LRVLAAEDDLGLALIQSLTDEQRKIAVVDHEAYKDILTTNSRKAALEGQPSGLAAAQMNVQQKEMLQHLLDEYANNMPEQLAQARLEAVKQAGAHLYFAWSGGTQAGEKHYYRVQSPSFLVELDDTQDQANHIHSVWRDFNGDFGRDLLKEHYQQSHSPQR
jgi:hypothetical protein